MSYPGSLLSALFWAASSGNIGRRQRLRGKGTVCGLFFNSWYAAWSRPHCLLPKMEMFTNYSYILLANLLIILISQSIPESCFPTVFFYLVICHPLFLLCLPWGHYLSTAETFVTGISVSQISVVATHLMIAQCLWVSPFCVFWS